MNNYPLNFDIEDIIDSSYYEKHRTKSKIKTYKLITEVKNERN